MPTAYTDATQNPVTMTAARIMWTVWDAVDGLNIAGHRVDVDHLARRPAGSRAACSSSALAATTKNAPAMPATTIGMPVSMCARGGSRSQP